MVPLRRAADRRQAQLEIDALIALSLDIGISELTTIYRTQFPVLYGYDHDEYLWDSRGRLVPTEMRRMWKKSGGTDPSIAIDADARTTRHPGSGNEYIFELPFGHYDRAQDLRAAYTEFERRYAKLE